MITIIIITAAYIFIGFIAYCLAFRHQIKITMLNYGINKATAVNRFDDPDYFWFMICGIAWPFMLLVILLTLIHRHILAPLVMKSIKEN